MNSLSSFMWFLVSVGGCRDLSQKHESHFLTYCRVVILSRGLSHRKNWPNWLSWKKRKNLSPWKGTCTYINWCIHGRWLFTTICVALSRQLLWHLMTVFYSSSKCGWSWSSALGVFAFLDDTDSAPQIKETPGKIKTAKYKQWLGEASCNVWANNVRWGRFSTKHESVLSCCNPRKEEQRLGWASTWGSLSELR